MASKPKIKGPSEKEIQDSILEWLSYQPKAFVWRQNNVGIYDPITKGFRRLPKYSMRGVSDIIGLWNGKGLAIECKSKKGKLTDDQETFLKRFKEAGGITIVARSIEDVCAVLLAQ